MSAAPPPGPAERRAGATPAQPDRQTRRLHALLRGSRYVLFWERLWPALWPLLAVVMLFVAAALLGLFSALPPLLSGAARLGFIAAALAALWPLARLRWPSQAEALARLDRSVDGPDARIASAFFDQQATGLDDPLSRALWRRQQDNVRRRLSALRLQPPRIAMADRDRYGLRAIPVLALALAVIIAGPDWREQLQPALRLHLPLPEANAQRLDGWIDPPRYTRRPPLMLDLTGPADEAPLRVPVNSILVLQAAGGATLKVEPGAGLAPVADDAGADRPAAPQSGLQRARYRIIGHGPVTVRAGGVSRRLLIETIADAPPKIALKGRPEGGARGSLGLSYSATDDYGLASGVAEIRLPGPAGGRSLAEPPDIRLNLPANPADGAVVKTVAELASHPWAGAEVDLTLVVTDDAGQQGRSETVRITLPERTFADPLARALIEQRRALILTPDQRELVQTALDALLIAPELFTPKAGYYLGLRRGAGQLRTGADDEALRDVAAQLWELALVIEDGDLSDAERRLRQAQQALRDGIERGAGEEEMRRLSQELRQAMDRYMAEMSRQAQRRAQQPTDPNATNITQDDLQKLLDRIQELTREGRREEAARLLDRLRELMENLQMAAPGQGQGKGQGQQGGDEGQQGETAQRLGKALGDLDALMREQQALRDETFRQGQKADQAPQDDGEGAQGEGPQGEGPQGEGAQAQGPQGRGQGKDQGAQPGQRPGDSAGAPSQGGSAALRERQQALQRNLEALRDQLKRDGADTAKGFGEAGEDMKGAGEALQRDSHGEAVDAQGRALDQLRRSAQDLARQMAETDGKGRNAEGQAGQDGDAKQDGGKGGVRSGSGPETDPLGRPLRGADRGLGGMESGEAAEAAGARARRILDELRRRLGERQRERDELDYLERLLGPR